MLGILLLLIGASEIFIGILVLKVGYNKKSNYLFFVFAIITGLWVLSNYLIGFAQDIFWLKMAYALGSLIYPSSLLWILHFLNGKISKKVFLLIFFLGAIFFITPLINGFVVGGVTSLYYGGFEGSFGSFFNFYILYSILMTITIFYFVIKGLRETKGLKRQQLKYITSGFVTFGLGAALTSFIIPIFGNNKLIPLDSISSLPLLLFISYSIFKHKLLDFRALVLRTVSYSLLIILIAVILVSFAFYLLDIISNYALKFTVLLFASILLVFYLEPLKRILARITDKFFYKAKIEYGTIERDLAEVVNREIDLKNLMIAVDQKLTKGLKVQKARILLPDSAGLKYETLLQNPDILTLKNDSSLVRYLKQNNKITILESLERKIEDTVYDEERKKLEESKAELDRLDVAIAAPVTTDNKLAAILILGNKKSGDTFSQEDLNLLEVLGPQLASAIEKSRLYDQIRRFNVKLQKEIAISTEGLRKANEDLQDRNRFLTSIQAVTQLITRSLDFQTVTQAIVDSISTQMGFIGGVLLFYGEDRHKLFPEAITRVKYTEPISKLLPKPIREYHIDVRKEDTKLVKAMLTGEIQRGEKFSEFISPPVPTMVASGIQQLVHGHSFLAVPIRSENEVVGCIIYLLEESIDEINQNDINMMNSLADQTGIIYRNLELVQKLRRTNDELEEANEHLKQLDKAKSEFVSIASHQLRTPMTGIMGYLSMITTGDFGKVPKQLNGILNQLLDASQKMIQLINLFLDVSKIESGKLVLSRGPHKIEEIIDRSIQVIGKIAADKGLKLEFVRPAKPIPTLQIDDKIFDVVSNLIDNAIKYTEKGSITVTAEKIDDHVKVTVKDTGRGIPPEEAKNLFNKFVRGYGIAQVNPDGSGLGLYVARRLTEAHGGRIWVESKGKNKGSSFMFELPLKPPTADEEST